MVTKLYHHKLFFKSVNKYDNSLKDNVYEVVSVDQGGTKKFPSDNNAVSIFINWVPVKMRNIHF